MAQTPKSTAEILADSKKVLADADKFQKSAGGPLPKPPVAPVKPAPKPKAPQYGLLQEASDAGRGIKALGDQLKEIEAAPKMHKGGVVKEDGIHDLKKGEVVIPADKLKEGDKAMKDLEKKAKGGAVSEAIKEEENEPTIEENHESKKAEKKEGKHKTSDKHNPAHEKKVKHNFHRTETIHHPNGSHTTTHHPHPPKPSADGSPVEAPEPVSYASPDDESMLAAMKENLGGGEAGGSPSGAPQA